MEVFVKCPYCGAEKRINHYTPWNKDYLVTCGDDGKRGCLSVFIAQVVVEITANAKKVEEEG